jgi:hypothetical protein
MKLLVTSAALALLLTSASAFAMTDPECEAAFTGADTDKNGALSETEASAYFASARLANKPINGTLTKQDFLANCKSNMYTPAKMDDGAPLKGANSFTETQAKDWVLSRGFTEVSVLAKDGDGIWRGTAKKDGKQMAVAVDYKGNVVAN